jgi:DNA-binding NtrC family response regulator
MPRVDGFAVLEYLSNNDLFDSIPVSIISGDSTKETINKAYKYPIVDMLEKPFSENTIKNVVEKTLMYKDLN